VRIRSEYRDSFDLSMFLRSIICILQKEQQFIQGLEELLNMLFSGDTDPARIRTATSALNSNYYSSPACVPALVHILSHSSIWQVETIPICFYNLTQL
ncbi:7486_t:CDS:2, partial [Acaulospora morrowiae]